jgi:hypothetical protein
MQNVVVNRWHVKIRALVGILAAKIRPNSTVLRY